MRLSTKGQYAVRAMLVIALHCAEGPVPLRRVADLEDISEQYLEQIFMDLKRAKLVDGVRGAKGGYLLARPAEEISSGDIVCAVEGPISLVECDHALGQCDRAHICVTRDLWAKVSGSMREVLEETSLAELVEWARARVKKGSKNSGT